ncbi:helix-turn-helix domain-containing protein [Actinokineospora sp. PR83]|uniref:helix-turn-helix domain-containing protein n=1 Tax=Actinokineospora sp. PR83 TaxID=2884908 RepID=UPI001F21EAB6|nr:helix-turn-helix transcriptional regulator [Actinokineospora sp. PR83]MCG8915131.1 helix-turn-helix domain-containing protein [Actinokineospora sp. PR83]
MTVGVRIWHRVLGMTLTRCRHDRGLTTRQAAARLGMSPATLNRSENATRPFDPVEVGAALATYQPSRAERARVPALAQGPRTSGWWAVGGIPQVHEDAVMALEDTARSVIEFSATEIRVVAQIPHYTRALCWNRRGEEQAALARACRRHRTLLNPTQPDRTIVLDEALLRRPVGGPTAMAQQLRHLLALTRGRSITVRVIPVKEGGYRCPGNCAIYRIIDKPTVAHLWSHAASGLLDDPSDTRPIEGSMTDLLSIAVTPNDSLDLLNRLAADHERTAGLYP